jgi:PAS domain S-box-containing protein
MSAVAPSSSGASRSLAGPLIPADQRVLRYGVSALLIAAVVIVRHALAPWLGLQAPLLPFLVSVLVSAYLCGRGPAIFVSVAAPLLATFLFTAWPNGTHPVQWSLHVALFLSAALVICFIVDRLQRLHHSQQAALAAAQAAEHRAAQSATQLHLALRAGRAGNFEWDLRTGTNCWSEELEALHGFAPGEFAGTHEAWLACVVPEDRERMRQLTQRALTEGELLAEYRIRRNDTGEIRWLQGRGQVFYEAAGAQPLRMLGIIADITKRKEAELAVLESEHRLRLLAEHLPASIGYVDREGYLRFANAAYRQLASDDDAPLVGRHVREVLREEAFAQRQPYIERALHGELVRFEGPVWHSRLGARECEIAYVPDIAGSGDTMGFYVMLHDITERMRAERALREREQMLKLIYDHSSDSLYLLAVEPGEQYRVVSVNATFLAVSGYADAQAEGRLIEAVLPPANAESARAQLRALQATRAPVTYYETASLPSGLRHGEVTLIPIIDGEGVITHVLAAIKDVTARKQAEAALLEADRRKDEFLAMLAHELRNPLAAIRNVGHLLARDHSDPARVHRYGESLDRQATQLTRLLDDLLDVARITRGHIELRRERLALSDILDAAIETTQPLLTVKRQVLNFTADPALWVEGDAVRLTQVFSNLLTNASKFSPDRSMIEVQTEHSANEVSVRIRDEGSPSRRRSSTCTVDASRRIARDWVRAVSSPLRCREW